MIDNDNLSEHSIFISQVKNLREITGCGLEECKNAIKKCKDFSVAYEYLSLRGCAVYRAKINESGEKIPFSESDYIELAKKYAKERENENP